MADVEHAGAAMRRRQRRLRQWHRHERMTVAMALAEATHHAAPRGPKTARAGEGVEHEQHVGLRALKPPLPGVRPGSLFDSGPQRSDRTVRHSAGDTPFLVVPALRGHDGVDGTTLRFLVKKALDRQKEEEKVRKWRDAAEGDEGGVHGAHGPPEDEEDQRDDPPRSPGLPSGARGLEALDRPLFVVLIWEEEEEEEEEEEADASYLLSSWTRSSSTAAAACSCVSLRHVVDVPVVRYVQFPQVQRRDLRRLLHLLPVQVDWQGSQRAVGGVSVL